MRRRDFVKATALGGMALGAGSLLQGCEPNAEVPSFKGKRLVLVRLDGGNDGLFSLFPREHDLIDAHRPELRRDALRNAIETRPDWMLHREWAPLMSLWENQEAAFLPFVGYPEPNTSHFVSSEIWEMGGPVTEIKDRTGWIGRLLDEGKLMVPGNEFPVLSLSGAETIYDRGNARQGFQWQGNELMDIFGGDIRHWLQHFHNGLLHDDMLRQYTLMQWLADTEPAAGFPETGLGLQMGRVASMIRTDKPFMVYHVQQGGYDTHTNAAARLGILYKDLIGSLKALAATLRNDGLWKETLVFVYSEFGRTIDENASGGTDHGAAGLCLLLGDNGLVRRYAALPWEIRFQQLAGEPYLLHQLDFRDLYHDFQEQWLLA